MGKGRLLIETTVAQEALPLEGVFVRVFSDNYNFNQIYSTNAEGKVGLIELPAPDRSLSLDQSNEEMPYSVINVELIKNDYTERLIYDVQVFDGETSLLQIEMMPNEENVVPNETTVIPRALLMDEDVLRPEAPILRDTFTLLDQVPVSLRILHPVIIPEKIRVHLGRPSSSARNVSVSFIDYIKNVASSEIYPTWPKESLRANILAQISLALNRVYTEWYSSQGYNFDITNSTAYDQYYVHGRNIFESVSEVVDDIFNNYIRKINTIDPYYAEYCDGKQATCPGMKQWGTVDLANRGYNSYEILRHYYGNDIEIAQTDRIEGIAGSYPGMALRRGTRSDSVAIIQNQLNRIAINYPNITPIYPVDGVFGEQTENSVKIFQRQFNLTADGIVGNATWYKINYIYVAVKKLAELGSEGIVDREIGEYPGFSIRRGDRNVYVQEIQFFLQSITEFTDEIPSIKIDGNFGKSTEAAVIAFQRWVGIPADGIVGRVTWNRLVSVYKNIQNVSPPTVTPLPYPGTALRVGSRGEDVRLVQEALNQVNGNNALSVDGIFGSATERAVRNFQSQNGLSVDGVVGNATWTALFAQFAAVQRILPIAYSEENFKLYDFIFSNYNNLIYNIQNANYNLGD